MRAPATAGRSAVTSKTDFIRVGRLLLFFVDFGELVGNDFGDGEVVGGAGFLVGGVRRAQGFEDAAGVLAAAHGHAAGAGDLEDDVVGLAEDLNQPLDFAGRPSHL